MHSTSFNDPLNVIRLYCSAEKKISIVGEKYSFGDPLSQLHGHVRLLEELHN